MPIFADLRVTAKTQRMKAAVRRNARAGDLFCGLVLHRHLDDPYPVYERIRAHGPVYRSRMGFRLVSAHGLCKQVLRTPEFVRRNASGGAADTGGGRAPDADSFLDMEAADHLLWRRLVAPAFRPKVMAGYRDQVWKVANELLDRAADRGRFDLVSDFAAPLPITVISEMLGITEVDVDRFAHFGLVTAKAIDGIRSAAQAREYRAAMRDLDTLFTALIDRKRRDPGEDIVSTLLHGAEGEAITSRELAATCQLLLTAGFETTTNLVGNAVSALLRHPDQWAALVADPGLAPHAVEEVLRVDPPVQYTIRAAHEPTELAGEELRKGAVVVLLLAAANRDPDVYPHSHGFDITRSGPAEHLAFMSGAHYCVGAPLARMEGDVALRALAERMPGLRVAGPPRRRPTAAMRGFLTLPVTAGR